MSLQRVQSHKSRAAHEARWQGPQNWEEGAAPPRKRSSPGGISSGWVLAAQPIGLRRHCSISDSSDTYLTYCVPGTGGMEMGGSLSAGSGRQTEEVLTIRSDVSKES